MVFQRGFLAELQSLPPFSAPLTPGPAVEVSFIIPARMIDPSIEHTVLTVHTFLSQRFGNSFEIILVPNSENSKENEFATSIGKNFANLRIVPHSTPRGKGAAMRTGFFQSRGKWIYFTDADLPYDLDFFDQAAALLRKGTDLVTGNRRLPTSTFQIPVSLLKLASQRHRLGLAFNRFVRMLLPIQTTDTQAGIKAFSRRLAEIAFGRQSCPGFLFDLELFLTAHGQGFLQRELPVTLSLRNEKSTVRVLRECLLVGNWLIKLSIKNLRKDYGRAKKTAPVLSYYPETKGLTRLFLWARWLLTPYSKMVSYLPAQGEILDLGCGHGLLSLTAALGSPGRQVYGIDHDQERVALAQKAIQNVPNVQITTGNMGHPPGQENHYSGMTLIDVLHYFEPSQQEAILKRSYSLLNHGGTLLVREVDLKPGLISYWNRFYELVATTIGFTQAEKQKLSFRSRLEWETLLEDIGFQVRSERCSSFLFEDILYICERPLL